MEIWDPPVIEGMRRAKAKRRTIGGILPSVNDIGWVLECSYASL